MENPTEILQKLLETHNLNITQHDGWLVVNDRLPALRATWSPGEKVGRLNIEAALGDERLIVESFGGMVHANTAIGCPSCMVHLDSRSIHTACVCCDI